MQLLLSSGDRILIDTAQRVPVPPGILRQKEICLVACVAKKRHSPAASKGSLSISLVPCDSFWKSGPSLPTLSESSHNRPPTYLTPIPLRRTRVSRAASRPHTN